MSDYCHLHNHTQFSLLDGHSSISSMISKAKADGQQAVAITDHGNMFGAFKFVAEANKQKVKPIVGCEFYLVEDRFQKSFVGGKKDKRYHQLLLAKDIKGYENLSKLCSLGFIEGLYSKWPRVDFELIKQYKEGLIATSCCIGAIIPQTILHKGEEAAEAMLLEWVDVFGEDYYVELQRHGLDDIDNTGMSQEDVNQVLIRLANKHNIPIIATNDSHYIEEDDASAHDILLCVNTGESKYTPKGHGKGFRFGFPNNEFYFKSQAAMKQLFSDVPNAIENTMEIADKVKGIHLERDVPVLPKFSIPEGFESEEKYLEFLTFEGAKKRYGEPLESHVLERL
ncbi:MAG: PHP domain-containing protein [Bacteroidota bacterium]|nr:PHP domain-containing protein [Bacteroidota bacterium]